MKEESEKVGLKLNIPKTKIMASGPITSWQIDGGKMETVEIVSDFTSLLSGVLGTGLPGLGPEHLPGAPCSGAGSPALGLCSP